MAYGFIYCIFNGLRFAFKTKVVTQQQGRGEHRANRIGDSFSSENYSISPENCGKYHACGR